MHTVYSPAPIETQRPISRTAQRALRLPFGKQALAIRRGALSVGVLARDAILLRAGAFRRSATQLDKLHNSQAGATGVIVCNGPSLNKTDLARLRGVPTILMNRGYLLGERIDPQCVAAVCVSARPVLEQYGDEINQLASTLVVPWLDRKLIDRRHDVVTLTQSYRWRFASRLRTSFYPGYTVTFLALQMAYHLGWSKILIVGMDHSYDQTGDPSAVVKTKGEDLNHFDPNYFQDGSEWLLPELSMNENSYKIARAAIEANGREVIDCTVGGKCEVFEKGHLEDALKGRTATTFDV